MKLSSFHKAAHLVGERTELEALKRGAGENTIRTQVAPKYESFRGPGVSWTIDSGAATLVDEAFTNALREPLQAELQRRIEANARALEALGVEID